MNNYHLYEEIGQGKFSMVYKGRKRYTIRYVAVKSIEKSRREKVVTEVRVLSQLNHPNVVGFVNWYETRNHLWIIYEYCAGGDLLHLLKQDGRLPEEQVWRFGWDISSGLLHVHSRGIVYSDLKPGNVLFNEHGALKLCGFGRAQVFSELERMLEERTPAPRRGTPAYMAPELFHEGGVHSFASDFWSLGCLLFELGIGRPPFVSASFEHVQQMVLWEPTPPMQGLSADLRSLLAALLKKTPLERPGWPALRSHAFWRGAAPGDEDDAELLPVRPHVEEQQRSLHPSGCGGGAGGGLFGSGASLSGVRSAPTADGSGSASVSPPSPPVFSAPLRAAPGVVTAAVATSVPGGAPAIDGRVKRRSGGCQIDRDGCESPEQVVQPQPAAGGAPPAGLVDAVPSGLRERLGAAIFVRARDLLAAAETGVRPIAKNPQIEEPERAEALPTTLPFALLKLDEVCARPHAELESFLMQVYSCIASGSLEQKLGAVQYLEQVCSQQSRSPMQVADFVVNSSLLRLVVRMLSSRRPAAGQTPIDAFDGAGGGAGVVAPTALRTRLLSLIGQLLRQATYLEPSVAELGLFDTLIEALADQDVALRRRAAAALGELLFYVAAQPVAPGTPSAGTGASGWHAPDAAVTALVFALVRADGDEVVQHYAAKTIENIATQRPTTALRWFFSSQLVRALAFHVRRSMCAPFRVSCFAACAHLVRAAIADPAAAGLAAAATPDSSGVALAMLPDLPGLIDVSLTALAPQGVPTCLQLIAAVLFPAAEPTAVIQALPAGVPQQLAAIASQPRFSAALRARAVLLLAALSAADDQTESRILRAALGRSFAPHVDRLGREKDRLVVQCVATCAAVVDAVALELLQRLVDGLRQLAGGGAGSPAADSALAGALANVIPIFWHLAGSAVFCACVLGSRALPLLGLALGHAAQLPTQAAGSSPSAVGQGAVAELQPLLLTLMETLGAQQALLLEHAPQTVSCLLAPLALFLRSPRADVRLLALISFSCICITLLNDAHIFDPMAEQLPETTYALEALLCGQVLPALPGLLADEPPAPSFAFRLLAALLSRGSAAAGSAVKSLGLAPRLLAAMSGEQVLTLPSALLAHCLLQGREVQVHDLDAAGVLDAVYAALADAADPASLDFAMLDAALGIAEEAFAQQLDLADGPDRMVRPPQVLLADLGPLALALPLLASLCAPLAHAKLAPLLDRTASCCQHLAGLVGRCCGSAGTLAADDEPPPGTLPLEGALVILEALSTLACWRSPLVDTSTGQDPFVPRGLQRRLISVLSWAVVLEPQAQARAEIAAGVERLLRDGALGDDPGTVADARALVVATVVGRDDG